jgi:hypothetical protein
MLACHARPLYALRAGHRAGQPSSSPLDTPSRTGLAMNTLEFHLGHIGMNIVRAVRVGVSTDESFMRARQARPLYALRAISG